MKILDFAQLRSWFAAKRATALDGVDRPEFDQSRLRVGIGGAAMLWLFWYSFRDGATEGTEVGVLAVSVTFFVFSVALTILIVASKQVSVVRRYVAMVADNLVTTICLMRMGEGGAVVIGVYLFITFGNGFRYGPRYLYMCQAMALAGFSAVMIYSEFWSQHRWIGYPFLLALVFLPVYVGRLSERLKEAKRRADEASNAKGRFVANVSHEMRTPLNGVIAMADVLRETDLNESQREIVETMTTSAQLLLAQIEDVLDMAKIEAGRAQMEIRPFDMGRVLSSIVKVIVPQARYKGIDVTTDVAPEVAGWFAGDSHHLRQVLLNLLSNAVKFTERGEITLRARALDASDPLGVRMRIEVQDTGIGIPESKQAAIFEPFTQADDSITRMYGGTGLGTTIARHLVKLMGGEIGVHSTPGTGSLFWIELTLPTSAPQGLDLAAELTSNVKLIASANAMSGNSGFNVHKLRGARVLVAEDNATNQRVAQLILESGGHTVTIVNNGEGALDALERGGFDIALFDLSMPVVSGLEALKLYRFTNPNPIPVLILSANVTTEAIAECQSAGAAEFIAKPLRASLLLDTIDRHLAADVERAPPPPRRGEDRAAL
ncbi:MAG: ATP-binding protein, partial [Betaproteobacteria bacterium]